MKPIRTGYILQDFSTVWYYGKGSENGKSENQWLQEVRGGGKLGEHRELSWMGSKGILYDTVVVATHHYTFVKTTEYTAEMNSNVNFVFWVITMCPSEIHHE